MNSSHDFCATYEPFSIPYELRYWPDFGMSHCDAPEHTYEFFIEAKGYFRPEDRVKMLAVQRSNPELDIRFIFQKDNKISKKTKYSDWAERHGFMYAIGDVPGEWIE